jgi:hypothetical protein
MENQNNSASQYRTFHPFLQRLREYRELIAVIVFFIGGALWIFGYFATIEQLKAQESQFKEQLKTQESQFNEQLKAQDMYAKKQGEYIRCMIDAHYDYLKGLVDSNNFLSSLKENTDIKQRLARAKNKNDDLISGLNDVSNRLASEISSAKSLSANAMQRFSSVNGCKNSD